MLFELLSAEWDPAGNSKSEGWPGWLSVETAARYLVSEERLRELKDRRALP